LDLLVVLPVCPPVAAGPPVSPTALPVVTPVAELPLVLPAALAAGFFVFFLLALACDFFLAGVASDCDGSFADGTVSPAANAWEANRAVTRIAIKFFMGDPFEGRIQGTRLIKKLECFRQFLFTGFSRTLPASGFCKDGRTAKLA
jgi:hypothetical protein